MPKSHSMSKNLSKSTNIIYNTNNQQELAIGIPSDDKDRRNVNKLNLKKMLDLKKENLVKSKDIFVSYN